MTSYNFQITTHGKWILAGEHAVIRGGGALVFPLREKKLTLSFSHNSTDELSADYTGDSGADMHLLFWSVLEQGMQMLGKSLNQIKGYFHLYNDIPIGVGMGASAALCVAMTHWFESQHFLPQQDGYEFARELENLFHGQSSGLDIAGVAANKGIYFKESQFEALTLAWKPIWFLSSCEQIGITSHCINQVKSLWKKDPAHAATIDKQMNQAVNLARHALAVDNRDSLLKLAEAIESAHHCFRQWGLISENLEQHMTHLKQAGAIAVKPTGSGGGGNVISLWKTSPAQLDGLIPI